MKRKTITAIGYDLSTTALSVVGRTNGGEEAFVSMPMRGATVWRGQPAFDLDQLPGLFVEALEAIKAQSFELAPGVVISGSVRQHDMVLLGKNGRPLIAALSWQCNAATKEVDSLRAKGAEIIVGRLEPRLILPKLLWALNQDPDLESKIGTVMTTGDFVAMQLTGVKTLSSSEALSNGLLVQSTRAFAREFIDSICGHSGWFPPVVKSGRVISWNPIPDYRSPDWDAVRSFLSDWIVTVGLGDNHAGAVGSGLTGRGTIVVSAGTSGTVTRAVKLGAAITGTALKFEYYDDILLLSMMADCASWYERFVKQFTGKTGHAELDALALAGNAVYRHPYPATPSASFEHWFFRLPLGAQVKTTQSSIAHHLAKHFRNVWQAVAGGDADHIVRRAVLTGGLTRSLYFCQTFQKEIRQFGFKGEIRASSRLGPLATQAACLGALINALVGGGLYPSMKAAIKDLCPSRSI